MSYSFVAASLQYITHDLATNKGAPVTFSGLAQISTAGTQVVVGYFSVTANTTRRSVGFNTSRQATAIVASGVGTGTATSSAALALTTWGHVAATAPSGDASRSVWLNNVSASNSTAAGTPTNSNMTIGAFRRGTPINHFDGLLAEIGVWDVELTDREIQSLSKGFSPRRIRPQSLFAYIPLVRNLQELRSALSLTNTNGATVADHPRVY
jgi:hypothetical protein